MSVNSYEVDGKVFSGTALQKDLDYIINWAKENSMNLNPKNAKNYAFLFLQKNLMCVSLQWKVHPSKG